jgi:hypothetical protein
LYTSVYNIIPKTIDFIIGETPDTKKFLHEYFEGKDKSENIDSTKQKASKIEPVINTKEKTKRIKQQEKHK